MLNNTDLVVWDFDGVFGFNYDEDGYFVWRNAARDLDMDVRKFQKSLFGNAEFRKVLSGEMDLLEEVAKLLPECGYHGTAQEFVHWWFTNDFVPNDGMLDLLADVQAHGPRCVLGTNNERHRMRYIMDDFGFDGKFDGVYAAGLIGVAKPDHGFFDHIMEAEGVTDKSRVLFIDDHPENIDAAHAYGWRGHLFGDLKKFHLGTADELRAAMSL